MRIWGWFSDSGAGKLVCSSGGVGVWYARRLGFLGTRLPGFIPLLKVVWVERRW